MRCEFEDPDLRRLYYESSFRMPRLGTDVVKAFRKKVALLEQAQHELELRQFKSLRLEQLQGDRRGQSSIRLNNQWRLVLRFEHDDRGKLIVIVGIVDYH
jgi:proteic killer suppression protein